MEEKFVIYDGVDGDVSFYESEEEATEALKVLIEDSKDDGEWMDGIENSFIAEINHKVNMNDNEEWTKEYGHPCYNMDIKKVTP
jgi:hypothetical protein